MSLFYANNVTPFGDYALYKIQQLFEKEMYI